MRAPLLCLSSIAALVVLTGACGQNETLPLTPGYDAGIPAPLACVPNLDGQIDSNEIQPAIGIPLSYLVSPSGTTRTVDVAGTVDSNNHTVWDFSVSYANDQDAQIQAQPLAGKWYAGSFPGGGFVVAQDAGDRLEGVIVYDAKGYHLLGLASTEQSPPEGQTLYVYDAPVDIFQFPLKPGQSFTTTGNVTNATLRGLPYAGRDTYAVSVDAAGTLILPSITFTQALRVRTTVTATPAAGQAQTTKQVSFVFECFGEVARATSQTGESQDNFTTAAEVRRLGLLPTSSQ